MKISQSLPPVARRDNIVPRRVEDTSYIIDTQEVDFLVCYKQQEETKMRIGALQGKQMGLVGLMGLMASGGTMLACQGLAGSIPGGHFLPVVSAVSGVVAGAGLLKNQFCNTAALDLHEQVRTVRPFSTIRN